MPLSHDWMNRPFGEIGRSVNPRTTGIGIRRAHDGRGAGVGVAVGANVGFTEEKAGGGLVGIGDPAAGDGLGDGNSDGRGDTLARAVADDGVAEGLDAVMAAGDGPTLGSTGDGAVAYDGAALGESEGRARA